MTLIAEHPSWSESDDPLEPSARSRDRFVVDESILRGTAPRDAPMRHDGLNPRADATIRDPQRPVDQADHQGANPALITEFGPLERLVADPAVTDIFVNGPESAWVDRGNGLERDASWSCPSDAKLRELAVRLVAAGGRHIDEATPCADVRLRAGIRVHVALAPIATSGTLISIRVPSLGSPSLDELDRRGMFGRGENGRSLRKLLEQSVRERRNILITGAGGSGKTTLLAALLATAPETERIIALEDVAELSVDHPHFISLEARQANLEGAGGIGLERLLREALRMRPDRLVVGECRGQELRELLTALNTGHDGGALTLHANSLSDVPSRLEALGALAGLSAEALARQAVSAIGMVVHLTRSGSIRQVEAVGSLSIGSSGTLFVDDVAVQPVQKEAHIARLEPAQGSARQKEQWNFDSSPAQPSAFESPHDDLITWA